jgi:alpha-D-xyloside xylohydrolase
MQRIQIMKKLIVCILAIVVFMGVQGQGEPEGFVREASGIRVTVPNGLLRLQVFSDRIIRVSFAPGESIPSKEEFSVVKLPQTTGWKAVRDKDNIVLDTRLVTARVDKGGTVRFYDRHGKLLLAELPGGRKMGRATGPDRGIAGSRDRMATQEGAPEQGFAVGDEALYGLGQFQNGLVNWKNAPLRLQQFNQEDAVPFLVSTKGYGVFWDNYSVTDFNPPSKELSFHETIDSSANIRRTTFTPTLSGDYYFAVESRNPENRFQGPVLLTVNGDTLIHYSTVWVPEWHTGRARLQAGKTYTIVLQNSNSLTPGKLYYNAPDYNKTVFRSTIGDLIDYYFVYGQTPTDIISGYRDLTGAAPMPGKWVLGFWQCRERYHSQEELLENAREYRERKIPVDMIVQDWNYWPAGTWGPEWNRQLYPDPAKMVQKLKEEHFHLMVSVWPRVANPKLESRYHFTGHTIDDSSGNLDLYSAEVRKNYYQMIKDSMFDIGVSSIWLDGSEPETRKKNAATVAGPFDKVALTYPLKVTQSLYEGQRIDFPGLRVFNFTRSAFPGMQRYGAGYWTGDVLASWEQLRQQIAGGLNFAMSGLPYWTTDAGGFFRDQQSLNPAYDNQYTNAGYKELLTRWFQFATFCPMLRIHGYVSNTEIWRYGADFEHTARSFIDLRYRLMPYLYSLAGSVTQKGALIMAPLVHDFPEDKNTWKISDQFLLGSSLLVNPVVIPGAHSRSIYLPKGDWYDFWTGSKRAGGRSVTVETSMEKIPLMVKAGTILPVGPVLQYAMQPDSTPLKIFVYPGSNGSFTLYEDEGENYNYEKGRYSIIPFQWNDKERTLTIGERKGDFSGMLQKRKIGIVLAGQAGVKGLDNTMTDVWVVYDGKRQIVRLQ